MRLSGVTLKGSERASKFLGEPPLPVPGIDFVQSPPTKPLAFSIFQVISRQTANLSARPSMTEGGTPQLSSSHESKNATGGVPSHMMVRVKANLEP
jgi:hypothetical protein